MLLAMTGLALGADFVLLPQTAALHAAPDESTVLLQPVPQASTEVSTAVIVAREEGWVQIRHHAPGDPRMCHEWLDLALPVEVWVRQADLALATSEPFESETVRLTAGVHVLSVDGGHEAHVHGAILDVALPESAVATTWSAHEALPLVGSTCTTVEPAEVLGTGGEAFAQLPAGTQMECLDEASPRSVRWTGACAGVTGTVDESTLGTRTAAAARPKAAAEGDTVTVSSGAAMTWPDGSSAGTTSNEITFRASPPSRSEGRICHEVHTERGTLPVCFPAGSVSSGAPLVQVAKPPQVIHTVAPRLPRRVPPGACTVDVMIDPSGKPSEVLPIDCDPANFEVARKTLMKWRWTPPIGPSGTPTTAVSTIDLDFTRR